MPLPHLPSRVSRRIELIALLLADAAALGLAFALQYLARFRWQWFGEPAVYPPDPVPAAVVTTLFFLVLFTFFGLYRERYAASRFDELVSLFKVVSAGMLILIFAIYIDVMQPGATRAAIFFNGSTVLGAVALGRIAVRSVQKALILRGHGTHRALVVGWDDRLDQLYAEVARYPEAGLDIVGAVRLRRSATRAPADATADLFVEDDPRDDDSADGTAAAVASPAQVAPSIADLPRLIDELSVQDVLIALGSGDHEQLMDVLRSCDGKAVALKLVPDFYSVIGGMARTEHMYGLPLIEVLPEPMPAWEKSTKRLLDVVASALVLAAGLPFWLVLGVLVRLSSPGPAIYRQRRVGQHGRGFTMYKFRTMRQDAEAGTGPVWASANDPRYTPLGRWLRKTRLDEVPQFWNVLKGDMSLVGPRPERPFFVDRLAAEIPLYKRRHRVKPGITGWAQVKWKYDESLEDVRQKVKYDLFYIENMSLRMDFKILFRTIRTAVLGQGQ